MSRIQVQLWYNRFKEGWKDVIDDARPGRRSTPTADKNIEAMKNMILNNTTAAGLSKSILRAEHEFETDLKNSKWQF